MLAESSKKSSGTNILEGLAKGSVGNALSAVNETISNWFWSLISGLPRGYFAKALDEVNYFDKALWEGMFRDKIQELKEGLESGLSEKVFEKEIVRLQGLVGKYSLSPVAYENVLKELKEHLSDSKEYFSLIRKVRDQFREELKAQPTLLKECFQGDQGFNLDYYKFILSDKVRSSRNTWVKETYNVIESEQQSSVNAKTKLSNICRLIMGSPAQAVTLFLAVQAMSVGANVIGSSANSELERKNSTMYHEKSLSISNGSNFETKEHKLKIKKGVHRKKRFDQDFFLHIGINQLVSFFTPQAKNTVEVQTSTNKPQQNMGEVQTNKPGQVNTTDAPRGTFRRADSNNNRIVMLEVEVNKLKVTVGQLRSSTAISDADRERISTLETLVGTLQQEIDNSMRGSGQRFESVEESIVNLTNRVNEAMREINETKRKAEERERSDVCVRDIEAHRFEVASQKLELISDDSEINRIVKKLYNHQRANFELVLNFGKSVSNIKRRFLVFKALSYEMESNGDNDIAKEEKLIENLESKVIYQSISSDVRKDAYSLQGKLIARLPQGNIN